MYQTTHYLRLLALPALALLMAACADDTDTPSTTTPDGDLTGQPIRFTATGLSVTPAGTAQTKAGNTETDFPAEDCTMKVTMADANQNTLQEAVYTYTNGNWTSTAPLLWPDTQNEYLFTAVSPAGTDIGTTPLPTEWTADNLAKYEEIRTTTAATKTKATQSLDLTLCHALVKVQVVSTSGQPVTLIDGETFYTLYSADNIVYEGYLLADGHTEEFQFISDGVYTVNATLVSGRLVTACDMPGYTAIVCPAPGQLSTVWPIENTAQVLILGELNDTDMETIREHANITDLLLKDVTSIGVEAFSNCSNLTTVSLPEATTIEAGAFMNCSSLEAVSLPKVTDIKHGAFMNCSSLETVSLPEATTIEAGAFRNCSSLEAVSLPKVTNIGDGAFMDCAINSICLPKDVLATKDTFLGNTENVTLFLIDGTQQDASDQLYKMDASGNTSKAWQTIYYGYKGTGDYLDKNNYTGHWPETTN